MKKPKKKKKVKKKKTNAIKELTTNVHEESYGSEFQILQDDDEAEQAARNSLPKKKIKQKNMKKIKLDLQPSPSSVRKSRKTDASESPDS